MLKPAGRCCYRFDYVMGNTRMEIRYGSKSVFKVSMLKSEHWQYPIGVWPWPKTTIRSWSNWVITARAAWGRHQPADWEADFWQLSLQSGGNEADYHSALPATLLLGRQTNPRLVGGHRQGQEGSSGHPTTPGTSCWSDPSKMTGPGFALTDNKRNHHDHAIGGCAKRCFGPDRKFFVPRTKPKEETGKDSVSYEKRTRAIFLLLIKPEKICQFLGFFPPSPIDSPFSNASQTPNQGRNPPKRAACNGWPRPFSTPRSSRNCRLVAPTRRSWTTWSHSRGTRWRRWASPWRRSWTRSTCPRCFCGCKRSRSLGRVPCSSIPTPGIDFTSADMIRNLILASVMNKKMSRAGRVSTGITGCNL